MKKIVLALIVLFTVLNVSGQTQHIQELNNYKYVVIPMKYDFLSKENEYLLNTTTKYLLKEQGFTTYMDAEKLPTDLAFNKCLALYADLESEGITMLTFATKVTMVLKDCRGNIVFETKEGKSREKETRDSYREALKDAFKSFSGINYQYNGGNGYFDSDKAANEKKVARKIEASKNESVFDKVVKSTYSYNGKRFIVEKIEVGYVIKEKESGKKVAFLNLAQNNSILYNSDTVNGTASFDEKGNLVVEYFNNRQGAMDKITYKSEN